MKDSAIILVNKPRGISSNSVVNIVKRTIGADKAGHLGTLDVAGEGLLPVTINKATKLFDYFLNKDKQYLSVFKFGLTTDTLDLEGKVTAQDNKIITFDMVQGVLNKFIGKFYQMPPIYSAKKIKGQKAYDLARRGDLPELKPKEIEIYNIKIEKEVEKNTFEFLIHCSSGTYIRSLCRDIATSLSTYGVMQSILRTKCGAFNLDNAFTLDDIKAGKLSLISPDTLFDYSRVDLSEVEHGLMLNGVEIKTDKTQGKYRLYFNDTFLGISEVKAGRMKFWLRLC